MTISLYRRYRPRTFDEVAGQDMAVDVLKKALRETRWGTPISFPSQGVRKDIPGQAPRQGPEL